MKMKKKLLFVTRGNEIGGGTEYLISLMRLLNKYFNNVEIHVTYGKPLVRTYFLQHINSIRCHHIPIKKEFSPISDCKSLIKLYRLINDESFYFNNQP